MIAAVSVVPVVQSGYFRHKAPRLKVGGGDISKPPYFYEHCGVQSYYDADCVSPQNEDQKVGFIFCHKDR